MIWYDITEESLIIKDTYYKDPYGRCLYWQCCYYKIPLKTSSGKILVPGAIGYILAYDRYELITGRRRRSICVKKLKWLLRKLTNV